MCVCVLGVGWGGGTSGPNTKHEAGTGVYGSMAVLGGMDTCCEYWVISSSQYWRLLIILSSNPLWGYLASGISTFLCIRHLFVNVAPVFICLFAHKILQLLWNELNFCFIIVW